MRARSHDLSRLHEALDRATSIEVEGRVRGLVGLCVRAAVPGARLGEVVRIQRRQLPPLEAEVIGFEDDEVTLMPYGEAVGIGPDDPVRGSGRPFSIRVDATLLGRVLDGLGRPMDGGPDLHDAPVWEVERPPPDPMTRARVTRPLETGIRVLDSLLTVGEGQRVGLFAGSGVGKSTLLGQIARQTDADVVVVCLVGERGREVRDFLEESLGAEGLARAVVVCATSDVPSLVRLKSLSVATAIAERFRDDGLRVLLLVDSVTRFARAQREIGLAAGEPPTRRGYPPSVFAMLPRLLERSGCSARGSITAIYTVLVEGNTESGIDDDPIADEVRGILDGHVVLSRALAERGRFPAVDVLQSVSRVMDAVVAAELVEASRRARAHLAVYEQKRDLMLIGAYKKGADRALDEAVARMDRLEAFLKQGKSERTPATDSAAMLAKIV
ncbi:MAG: FliI/YscN family ATPase [Deltaproteobacteria bacterium]|nr:FliI/YscN family ATPase [Deltaproteobacteria bacterium]